MKTLIHEIGIVDIRDYLHRVKLKEGLNVITGKSSTGKSALIEIFDYCFASSKSNIPKGVITESATLYYLVLQINQLFFVLGREANSSKCFFKIENSNPSDKLGSNYFDNNHFLSLNNYKNKLNEIFIDINDVDESAITVEYRGKKSPTPSIRSFMSLILQHQNLIANKHAIFYRFDEKEKREQVISHMKIFLGFVDQEFYILSQRKEKIEMEIRRIIRENNILSKNLEGKKYELKERLKIFYSVIGVDEKILSIDEVISDPINSKIKLDNTILAQNINHTSDNLNIHYNKLIKERDSEISKLRELQRRKTAIEKTLEDREEFSKNIERSYFPESITIAKTVCPLCYSDNNKLTERAKQLEQAIKILSEDFQFSNGITSELEISLNKTKEEITNKSNIIKKLNREILDIRTKNKELSDKISFNEQVLMKKMEIFFLLDMLSSFKKIDTSEKETYQNELEDIKQKLKLYNIENRVIEANSRINIIMKEIGSKFDFETSYQPINLKFSLDSFDLFHQDNKKGNIYLRTMGSGANWLYCHITLFLALHRYFIELDHKGINCSIPSLLFLDQPTQVYFPNFKFDKSQEFNQNMIKELEHNPETFDEDIKSVENLFKQLAIYCDELKNEFGFSPQIIVTDHADNLNLGNKFNFEDFVNGNRWRTRGLIEPIPNI